MEPTVECCGNGCQPCVLDLQKQAHASKRNTRTILNEIFCKAFQLETIELHTNNTSIYTFRTTEQSDEELGLDFDHYLMMKGFNEKNELIYRAYTPFYNIKDFENGIFKILIKTYPNGIMSKYINQLKKGDLVYFRGPYNKYKVKKNLNNILFIAGGTGIIPCLNIILRILELEYDTIMKLYFSIHSYKDILLKEQIKELNGYWNVEIIFCISEFSNEIPYYNAKVQSKLKLEDLNKDLINVGEIIICGPEQFNIEIKSYCEKQHINKNQIIIL